MSKSVVMDLQKISETLCDRLIASSHPEEAEDISRLMVKVLTLDKNDHDRANAIDSLMSRCHPRWLGDYYVNNITYNEWTDLITQFKNKLSKVK